MQTSISQFLAAFRQPDEPLQLRSEEQALGLWSNEVNGLPHAEDAERAILGAILLDNALMAQAMELLSFAKVGVNESLLFET